MKLIAYILFFCSIFSFGQKKLVGKVTNSVDVEGIHVFNKTFHKYTITNVKGEFSIFARVNDTIIFSGIQFQLKEFVVTPEVINKQPFLLLLDEQVNELDVVYIKPALSGDLFKDAQKIKTKQQVTAKTLGLPNAHVVPPSQAERRLYTATSASSPVDALINAISGRTKMLKKMAGYAKKTNLENSVISSFNQIMMDDFKIPEDKLFDFLYYASSDILFSQIVKTNSNIIIYDFIKAKSKTYLALQNVNE